MNSNLSHCDFYVFLKNLGELRRPYNEEVSGSIPIRSTKASEQSTYAQLWNKHRMDIGAKLMRMDAIK